MTYEIQLNLGSRNKISPCGAKQAFLTGLVFFFFRVALTKAPVSLEAVLQSQ